MAESYWCDSSIRARTLNVTWTECPGIIGGPTPRRRTLVTSGMEILMAKAPSHGKMAMSTLAVGETARCAAKVLLHSPMETGTLAFGCMANFIREPSMTSKQ